MCSGYASMSSGPGTAKPDRGPRQRDRHHSTTVDPLQVTDSISADNRTGKGNFEQPGPVKRRPGDPAGMATSLRTIEEFLKERRLAVVGVSRNPKDFTRGLYRELLRRGYQVIPVNPAVKELEGEHCFARLQDISPKVDAALLMTAPEVTDRVVRDCAEAGIARVWMHRGAGRGSVSPSAVDFCQARGIQVVAGYCPFMFLPQAPFYHRLHGYMKKLARTYPR